MNDHIAKPLVVADMFATMAKWITPSGQSSVVTAAKKTNPEKLAPIAGIDVERGLAICAGNVELYRKLLLKFVDANAGFEQIFRNAQASEDGEAPMRAAHNLKGVAANMGAREIATAAEALESACRNEEASTVISVKLREVSDVLGPVFDAIVGAGLGAAPVSPDGPVGNTLDVEASLVQLRELLELSDPKSRALADEILNAAQGTPREAFLESLIAQIDIYDFDEALALFPE
jgi:HPt (histidine-containing phosphotransfer) domain-containing protein